MKAIDHEDRSHLSSLASIVYVASKEDHKAITKLIDELGGT